MAKLLIVDDDEPICEEFCETLQEIGHEVDYALNGDDGLHKIAMNHYNMVFLDYVMPKMEGIQVLALIKKISKVPVAFISGFLPESKERKVLSMGACACLRKPLDLNRIRNLIKSVEFEIF